MLNDLTKLGYRVSEKRVVERSLLGGRVERLQIVIEGRDVVMRLSELSSRRFRVSLYVDEELASVLEDEGLEISELGEGTVAASMSFNTLAEALRFARSMATKLAGRELGASKSKRRGGS